MTDIPVSGRVKSTSERSQIGGDHRRSMTYYFVAIKLRILKNAFSGDRRLRFGMAVMILASAGGAIFAWVRLWQQRNYGGVDAANATVLFFSIMFGAWVFGPIMTGGVDDTLDPTKVALLPLKRDELRRGFVAASLTGYVPLATAIGLTGAIASFGSSPTAVVLVTMAVIVQLLLSLTAARSLAVVLALTSRSRRGRDVAVMFASIVGASIWLGAQSIKLLSDENYFKAINVLRWLPAGAIGQSVVDAREGRFGASALRILAGAGLALVLLQVWLRGLDRLLVLSETVRIERKKNSHRYPVLGRAVGSLGGRPWGAVMMKELRYISRSPSRRSAFMVGTIIGAPFAFVQVISTGQAGSSSLWFAPAALLFGLGASNNLLGADAASLWIECSSGLSMRTLLTGKSLAAVPYLMMPVLVSTVALGVVSQAWNAMFIMFALTLLCWGIPLGVGCMISVLAPFGQPDQANPYANRRPTAGEGCLIGFLGLAGLVVITVLALPVGAMVGAARMWGPTGSVFAALMGSALWSVGIWQVGLRWSARYAQKREAELLADMGARRR